MASTKALFFIPTLAFTVCLSAVAINVCIPSIPLSIAEFGVASQNGHLLVAAYLAGYTLGMIPMGLAADRYGRIPMFNIGLLVFTLVSVLATFAPNMETLVAARFVQGLGGTCGPVLARAMARDVSDGLELVKLTALLVTILAVATLVAPLFGSLAVSLWGWRAPFALNIVMGLISLVMVRRFLYETLPANGLSLQPGHSFAQQFKSSLRAFIASPQTVWGSGLVGFTFFGYMAIVAGLSSIVIEVYGYSASSVGIIFAAAVVFYVLSAQLGRLLLQRFNSYQQIRFGVLLFAICIIYSALLLNQDEPAFWWVWGATLPYLIGMGLVFSNATAAALAPLPKVAGFAASILGTLQMGLATLGAVLTSVFYDLSADSMLFVMASGAAAVCLVFLSNKSLKYSEALN